jgi:hypothetical protein
MNIILKLDVASSGTVTLNINSLGTKTVSKINSSGSVVNLSGVDLKVGKNYLFRYDGTQFIWVSSNDILTDGSLTGDGAAVPLSTASGATTVTAAGTTTLTVASKRIQEFTGTTTQIIVMPVTSTLTLGQEYIIINNSTGIVTVNTSDGTLIKAVSASTTLFLKCILITGTTAASWQANYFVPTVRTITATAPITIAGTTSADLSANRTLAITAATTGAAGSMSAADKTRLDELSTASSPEFVTVKLSGLTDLKVPKHVADATGLADTTITVDANNQMTNASQPAFLAKAVAQNSVTGDNTSYTVQFTNEIFDQNADFDATSTFTAPVTGKYLLAVQMNFYGLDSAHTAGHVDIVTSNRTYVVWYGNPYAMSAVGEVTISGCVTADMDASDTASIKLVVTNGTKVINAFTNSFFSGALIC